MISLPLFCIRIQKYALIIPSNDVMEKIPLSVFLSTKPEKPDTTTGDCGKKAIWESPAGENSDSTGKLGCLFEPKISSPDVKIQRWKTPNKKRNKKPLYLFTFTCLFIMAKIENKMIVTTQPFNLSTMSTMI